MPEQHPVGPLLWRFYWRIIVILLSFNIFLAARPVRGKKLFHLFCPGCIHGVLGFDAPILKMQDGGAAGQQQFQIVGDHIHGFALPAQALQHSRGLLHVAVVQPAGGLIKNQDIALRRQCGGNGNPLFLPTGKAHRVAVLQFQQVQPS